MTSLKHISNFKKLGHQVTINQECEAAGVPVPEYRTDASGPMVQFHTGARQEEKVTEKTLGKTPEEIIALLKNEGSLSIETLAEQIGKSASAVQRALRKLQETRVIERIGPHKGGHWSSRRSHDVG